MFDIIVEINIMNVPEQICGYQRELYLRKSARNFSLRFVLII
jgi:hypothetical protein